MAGPEKVFLNLPPFYSDHKAHAQTAEALKRRLPGIRALARRYNGFCAQLSDMKARSPIHKNAVIPKPVDINGLFDIGVDDAIWEDAGLDGDVEETPPAWLADEKTREGIKAMLMYERGKEEISRLNLEMQALFASLTEQYLAIEKAVATCTGESTIVIGRVTVLNADTGTYTFRCCPLI